MISSQELRDFKLADAAKIPPEQPDGLNIEGLAAWRSNELLIGFGNPLIAGNALLVPLKNPAAVVHGGRADFDTPRSARGAWRGG